MYQEFLESLPLQRHRCIICNHVITADEVLKQVRLRRGYLKPRAVVFTYMCWMCETGAEVPIKVPATTETRNSNGTKDFAALCKGILQKTFACETTVEEQLFFETTDPITDEEYEDAQAYLDKPGFFKKLKETLWLDDDCQ